MSDESQKKVVKKIQPYPIDLRLSGRSQIQGKILKLAETGFLCDLEGEFVEVGDVYGAEFVIPVFNIKISAQVKVIKTYDHYVQNQGKKGVVRIVECHAQPFSEDQRKMIFQFLQRIGQK